MARIAVTKWGLFFDLTTFMFSIIFWISTQCFLPPTNPHHHPNPTAYIHPVYSTKGLLIEYTKPSLCLPWSHQTNLIPTPLPPPTHINPPSEGELAHPSGGCIYVPFLLLLLLLLLPDTNTHWIIIFRLNNPWISTKLELAWKMALKTTSSNI